MTMKERGLDFCGLWRQGKGEVHEFLMQVVMWRIGCSTDATPETKFGVYPDKLWLRAEVIKYEEGSIYPKAFDIVLPRKGFKFVADTFYNNSCIYGAKKGFFVEFSGNIYGPSPLLHEMPRQELPVIEAKPTTPERMVDAARVTRLMNTPVGESWVESEIITLNERRAIEGLGELEVPECIVNEEEEQSKKEWILGMYRKVTACKKEPKGVE